MAAGRILIGISGWRYAPWRGSFYPKGLVQREELAYAASQVATIEINGSFYALQRPESYAQWHDQTPEDFVFAVKAPRFITHLRRLKEVDAPVANFFASGLFELRSKLGPILWQLPPQLPFDAERLDTFLGLLPHDMDAAAKLARRHDARVKGRVALRPPTDAPVRHALEIRHDSYRDPAFVALLRRHRVALVVADTAGRWPLLEDLTTDFVYVRLHGDKTLYESGYGDEALDHWAERLHAWSRGEEAGDARRASDEPAPPRRHRDVYVYFDNDVKVHAPRDAASLMHKLGLTPAGAHGGRR